MKTISLVMATLLTQIAALHAEGVKPNQQEMKENPAKGEIYLVQANQPRSKEEITKDMVAAQNEQNAAQEKAHEIWDKESATSEERIAAQEKADNLAGKVSELMQEATDAGYYGTARTSDLETQSSAEKAPSPAE